MAQITAIMLLKITMNQIRTIDCWHLVHFSEHNKEKLSEGADVGKYSSTDWDPRAVSTLPESDRVEPERTCCNVDKCFHRAIRH